MSYTLKLQVVFVVAHFLLVMLDHLLDWISGYSVRFGSRQQREESRDSYECSAHVSKVHLTNMKTYEQPISSWDFITSHESYVHPNIIFEDKVTLLSVSEDSVLFAMTSEECHLHHFSPFFIQNQLRTCHHIVELSIGHFLRCMRQEAVEHRLSELHVAFVLNTSRCGSSLLSQVIETETKSIVIDEPNVFCNFVGPLFSKNLNHKRPAVLKACVDSLTLACTKASGSTVVVFKVTSLAIGLAVELRDLYPNAKWVYLYREPAGFVVSSRSLIRLYLSELGYRIIGLFSDLHPNLVRSMFPDRASSRAKLCLATLAAADKTLTMFATAFFAGNLMSAQDLEESYHFELKPVNYRQLIANHEETVDEICRYVGIPVPETGIAGLPSNDSQRNSDLSRERLKRLKTPLTASEKRKVNQFLYACGLPDIDAFPRNPVPSTLHLVST